LGIGANTAIFQFVNAVILRELPVRNPKQLVFPRITSPEVSGNEFPYSEFEQIRDRNQSLSSLFAFDTTRFLVTVNGQTDFVWGQCVSGSFFSVLGMNPILGSDFATQDDQPGRQPVVIISYNYWKTKFGLDPGVLGKTIALKQIPFRIAGVAPQGFRGIELGDSVNIWMPMGYWPQVRLSDHLTVGIMGRLKPHVASQQVRAEFNILDREYLKQAPTANGVPTSESVLDKRSIEVLSGARGFFALPDELPNELNILMMVVGLVLLIACANVANLLLARAVNRKKEIALRLALGAGRLRLIRQLLAESLLLAITGGALGVLLASWAAQLLIRIRIGGIDATALDVRADQPVLWFAAGISLLTGLVFGLAPAFGATRIDPVPALKAGSGREGGGESRRGLGQALVVVQVALCVSLLIGAGLMIRSLQKLSQINPGFRQEHVLLVSLYPTASGYQGARELDLYSALQKQVGAAPGTLSASISRFSLLRGGRWVRKINNPAINKGSEGGIRHQCSPVSPQFFTTMGIPQVLGRDFHASDGATSSKVAIISESLARVAFPNQNPLGNQIRFVGDENSEEALVVGVVGDVRSMSLRVPDDFPSIYIPLAQAPASLLGQVILEVRTATDPSGTLENVRGVLKTLAPNLPVTNATTQVQHTAESLGGEQSLTTLLSVFGALAIILASIGLYGVIAYSVARRTHEIGIRVALGADRSQVLRMVLGQGLQLTLIGVGVGFLCAAIEASVLANNLYGVAQTDPITFVGVALLLTSVAIAASYIPARRAMKVDPIVALRYE
jgi:predicted permease